MLERYFVIACVTRVIACVTRMIRWQAMQVLPRGMLWRPKCY